jgi:hypothetical protein
MIRKVEHYPRCYDSENTSQNQAQNFHSVFLLLSDFSLKSLFLFSTNFDIIQLLEKYLRKTMLFIKPSSMSELYLKIKC